MDARLFSHLNAVHERKNITEPRPPSHTTAVRSAVS